MTKEEMFDALMDAHLDFGISFKDLDGNNLTINKMLGGLTENLKGKNDVDINSEYGKEWIKNDKKVVEENKTMTFVEKWDSGDAVHIMHATKFPIHNKDGEIIGTGVVGKIAD